MSQISVTNMSCIGYNHVHHKQRLTLLLVLVRTDSKDVSNRTRGSRTGKAHVVEKRPANTKTEDLIILRTESNEGESRDAENSKRVKVDAPDQTGRSRYQFDGICHDIDARDADDPLAVTDFVEDMYEHFRIKEKTTSAKPTYMERQSSINPRMRSILIDWLVDVHLKFHLIPETLYLTVNIIDRYLEKADTPRNQLQLVGITALLLASKYEEIYPPQVADIVSICDHAFTDREVLQMEVNILRALEYKITIPSAHCFLVRYLKAAHGNKRIVHLSSYILDNTLLNYELLEFKPSELASAAVMIARKECERHNWSPTLLRYTNYFEEDIIPVARAVIKAMDNRASHLDAVERKYSRDRFGSIAGTNFTI